MDVKTDMIIDYDWKPENFTVISGGQTGVDVAALIAAKHVGFKTGGWCPQGWKTTAGPNPALGSEFGVKEHPSDLYPPRTELNVRTSDGTICIATDPSSAGEKLTRKFILKHKKSSYNIHIQLTANGAWPKETEGEAKAVADWIKLHNIKTLNIAGNSERTSKGIQEQAILFLTNVFNELKR